MNPIDVLKREHEEIEMEMMELEEVMAVEIVNYPMLLHSFKKLCELWDPHENKEEQIFEIMAREGVIIPVKKLSTEHRDLRGHINKINESINSGSDYRVRKCFDDDLKVILEMVRKHMAGEDEILYTIALSEFTGGGLEEMGGIVGGGGE